MARLPVPGGDENTWGNVLNDFLAQAHNSDGSIKDAAITGLAGQSVSSAAPSDNDVLAYNSGTSQWEPTAPGAVSVPSATTTDEGIIQLAGDLGGTSTNPTVPGLTAHINDTADAHDASAISFAAGGTIAATDVQAAVAEVATDAASALSAHEADTTNVHGIANTANLETTTGSQAKVDTHASDTTSVHGIADTSALETTTGSQAKVDAHVNDTADAHDASAISFAPVGTITATDVQAAVADTSAALTTHTDTLHQPHIHVPAGWGEHWKSVRSLGGSQLLQVHIWSDSIGSAGQGASNARTTSVAGLIQADIQANYGDGGSGYLNHELSTRTGTWSGSFLQGFGGSYRVSTTSSATMTFSNVVGTAIRLFYRLGVTGSFRWRVDGGSYTTVNTTSTGTEPGIVVINVADGSHTVDVERLSGTVGIHGVDARRTTGAIVGRSGQSGRAMSQYAHITLDRFTVNTTSASPTITTPTPGSFRANMVDKYLFSYTGGLPADAQIQSVESATSATLTANATATASIPAEMTLNSPAWAAVPNITANISTPANGLGQADVLILMLGANDGATLNYNAGTWLEGASHIVRAYNTGSASAFSPDLIVVAEHQGNWFDLGSRYPEFTAAMASFARGNGGAFIDMWGAGRRSFSYWQSNLADVIHPNDAGHALYAQPIIDLLNSA